VLLSVFFKDPTKPLLVVFLESEALFQIAVAKVEFLFSVSKTKREFIFALVLPFILSTLLP
jgi:hypothetical protein